MTLRAQDRSARVRRFVAQAAAAAGVACVAGAVALAAEEKSAGGLPQFELANWPGQIFWLLVAFALLYWVVSTQLAPKIGTAIETRRERIADDLDEAARQRADAAAAEAEMEKALADARGKANAIAAETRKGLEAEIAEQTAAFEAAAAARTAEAEGRIATTVAAARASARGIAAEAGALIVERLTGRAASTAEIEAALDASAGAR